MTTRKEGTVTSFNQSPIIKPDEVKGFMGHKEAEEPTRRFYVLEKRSDSEDRIWELDGYMVKDGANNKELWAIHMVCPRCDKTSTIKSEKKAIHVTDAGLEVEPFRCAWPAEFGGQCAFTAGIVLPGGDDQVVLTRDGVRRRIDGVFKRA
jgi:hypothetical protein